MSRIHIVQYTWQWFKPHVQLYSHKCVYIYMYIYIYLSIYLSIYTYMYIYLWACMRVFVCVCDAILYTCTYTNTRNIVQWCTVRIFHPDILLGPGLNPWKKDPGFMGAVSTFGAAQTAITIGAGATYPFDTVRRRLQMQSEKPVEVGAGGWGWGWVAWESLERQENEWKWLGGWEALIFFLAGELYKPKFEGRTPYDTPICWYKLWLGIRYPLMLIMLNTPSGSIPEFWSPNYGHVLHVIVFFWGGWVKSIISRKRSNNSLTAICFCTCLLDGFRAQLSMMLSNPNFRLGTTWFCRVSVCPSCWCRSTSTRAPSTVSRRSRLRRVKCSERVSNFWNSTVQLQGLSCKCGAGPFKCQTLCFRGE